MNILKSLVAGSYAQWIICCGVLLSSLNCYAQEIVQTTWLRSLVFNSEIEAITTLSQQFLADSIRENAEHVGALLETEDGRILVTHGKANPGQEQVQFSVRRLKTTKVIALWHTHGAPGRTTERFSITDGDTVRQTGWPFYLISPRGLISVLEVAEKGLSDTREIASVSGGQKVFRRVDNGLVQAEG